MQRTLLGLAGLLTAATVFVAPLAVPSAIAQDFPLMEELDLTEEQRAQVQANFEERRAAVGEILTEEQQEQAREAFREEQNFRAALAAVDDLTEEQKADLQVVFQEAREDFNEILTEEQQAELQALIEERRQNRP
ncbi:MAG: Spy/CpxP family protein refolding chaperone [Cyanobacteria bacterium P01_F01_bin.86]